MDKYFIVPVDQEIEVKGNDADDALAAFAADMDSDMHSFFRALPEKEYAEYKELSKKKPVLTTLRENHFGAVFHSDIVTSELFNFYVLRRRTYKDGSASWNICCELNGNENRYLVIDTIRGTREDAVQELKNILIGSNKATEV